MNEDQLISSIREAFAEKKDKYYNTVQMQRKLVEKGLTPKEAMQAISISRAKQVIGMVYPPNRELCYQLLTEEDRNLQNRLIPAVKNVFDKKKTKYIKVDGMKQLLLQEKLTAEEAKQAISLAEANSMIERCFPYVNETDTEPAYKLLTKEELEAEKEEELQDLEEDTKIRKKVQLRQQRTKKEEKEAG